MIDLETQMRTMQRMRKVREKIVKDQPFFAELIRNLTLGVSCVGTACTDGKYLLMDPAFCDPAGPNPISDDECYFVFCHEVLHVALGHVFRRSQNDGSKRSGMRWNIACDLVCNAILMHTLSDPPKSIRGHPIPWQVFDKDAFYYSAEEIYDMLPDEVEEPVGFLLDSHETWEAASKDLALQAKWEAEVDAATNRFAGSGEVPFSFVNARKYKDYKAQLKWKEVLRRFLSSQVKENVEYGFHPPERRYLPYSYTLPGDNPGEEEQLKEIVFFIDASGSIPDTMMHCFFQEVEGCFREMRLSGVACYFNTEVSKPIAFCNLEEFKNKVKMPCSGGGTSFFAIFQYLKETYQGELPKGVVILTDGYAKFPVSPGVNVPVLWVIFDNPKASPSFGRCIHMNSALQIWGDQLRKEG